jgi:hypothetical protein
VPDAARIDRLLRIVLGLLLLASFWLRAVGLGHLPGITGDEAWYGVQAERWLSGEPVWRTPPGNLLNPFHTGVLILLQAVFEPAFWILRAPALLAGILLVPGCYWLLRGSLGGTSAAWVALLAGVTPIALAYARLGWDPSQLPLASLLVVATTLARRWKLAGGALLIACWVHPVAVFLLPTVVVAGIADAWRAGRERGDSLRRSAAFLAAGTVLAVGVALVAPASGRLNPARLLDRLADPGGALEFGVLWVQLLSGTSVTRYVVGEPAASARLVHDLVVAGLVLSAVVGFAVFHRRLDAVQRAFAVGSVASLVLFYLATGSGGIRPHVERYAVWSVVPALVCLALGWSPFARSDASRRTLTALLCVVGVASLSSYASGHLAELERTGGRSHRSFRTASVEPKRAALDLILASRPEGPIHVLAEDWWSAWPIRYLALREARVSVEELPPDERAAAVWQRALGTPGFVVAFANRETGRLLAGEPRLKRLATVDDPQGRTILVVYRREADARRLESR